MLGRYAEASDHCRQALEALREAGDRRSLANVWDSLGYTHFQLGEYPEAVAACTEALALQRAVADRYYQADVLIHLADAHDAMGDRDAAGDRLRQALVILDELDHADAILVQAKLADLAGRAAHGPGSGGERDGSIRSGR